MSEHLAAIDITRRRGDSFPIKFALTDSAGTAIDIASFTFKLVADPDVQPTDSSNNVLDLTGAIVGASTNGEFEFTPTPEQMDITPDAYHYEVQMIDAASKIRTIVAGKLNIEQDIVK